MVDITLYIVISILFAGLLYYLTLRDNGSVDEDDTALCVLCGVAWPIVVVAFASFVIIKIIGLFVKKTSNWFAFIDGIIHSIRRKHD